MSQEFCSTCPRKMSFVPEKFPENPRMAPEKYGMYVKGRWEMEVRGREEGEKFGKKGGREKGQLCVHHCRKGGGEAYPRRPSPSYCNLLLQPWVQYCT